jgi:integrase
LEIGLEIFERLEMPPTKRGKTNYPGVFYRIAERKGKSGEERVYYIVFKQDGQVIEEKVGRQFADNMTPAKASGIRAERIEGKRQSRKEIREQALAAKQADAAKNTIGKLWKRYNEFMPERKSLRTDSSVYRLHLENTFSQKVPGEIYTTDIDKLRQKEISLGKSPQTVKHILGLLRRIIRFGVKRGLCPDPDRSKLYFEMPTVDNQKTESLNHEQLKKYIEALDGEDDQNAASILRFALATGMRRSALFALRWDDVDFEHGFITLRGDAAKKGRTEKIPLAQTARTILSHVERSESPYIFPGRNGGQRRDFRRIARRVKKMQVCQTIFALCMDYATPLLPFLLPVGRLTFIPCKSY